MENLNKDQIKLLNIIRLSVNRISQIPFSYDMELNALLNPCRVDIKGNIVVDYPTPRDKVLECIMKCKLYTEGEKSMLESIGKNYLGTYVTNSGDNYISYLYYYELRYREICFNLMLNVINDNVDYRKLVQTLKYLNSTVVKTSNNIRQNFFYSKEVLQHEVVSAVVGTFYKMRYDVTEKSFDADGKEIDIPLTLETLLKPFKDLEVSSGKPLV